MPRRRRSTVRIRSRRLSRVGGISLAVAVAAALLVIVVRALIRTDEPVVPFVRTVEHTELVWRCDMGHEFHAAGQIEPRSCWTCGRPAYAVTQYACPIHGNFDALVQFRKNRSGIAEPAARKLYGKDWVPAETPLECPRCRRAMTRVLPETTRLSPREQGTRPERRERP